MWALHVWWFFWSGEGPLTSRRLFLPSRRGSEQAECIRPDRVRRMREEERENRARERNASGVAGE